MYVYIIVFLFAGASFGPGKILGTIADGDIDEASGCAASRIHPGILYTLNDHGGDNEVYALATNGSLIATLTISGSDNQDWEDLAVAPCTDSPDHVEYCIYIGMSPIKHF